MDKGAHFYKCDFQVHSPRDLAWHGNGAVSDEERKTYAEELIRACRVKGLGSIAVTDHHDFAFFPYVKTAANEELDDSGEPVLEDRRILVFPGIELTLTAPACQAILLLDARFPENLLQSVLTVLAISPAPASDAKHASIQRVPQEVISDFADLYKKLSSHEHLKGRFTVLPNVSETGTGTMLRSGFGNFYKSMPCVGGYTDGSVSKFGAGNLSIVEGKNREYGFKAVGVFQTSDNRKRNHEDLGKHCTWVKWSEPTAEALRQACLAKESRLSNCEPLLPNVWITSISVSASKFLGQFDLDLNQQYNAIIGGRGTGKSTILEYLRWGLCDQPAESEEDGSVHKKRKQLITNTLQAFEGEVCVTFLLNGVKHIVKRVSQKQEIHLKIGDAGFAQATEQQVRGLLPIQAYSQKQLSRVGDRIDELKRFVELPIKQDLEHIHSGIRDTESKLRSAHGDLIRKKEIEAEVERNSVDIQSQTKQLMGLRQGLRGISPEDQEIIDQKALYDNEQGIIDDLQNEMTTAAERVEELKDAFAGIPEADAEDVEVLNKDVIKRIKAKYTSKFSDIKSSVTVLSKLVAAASMRDIKNELKAWDKLKATFDKDYEAAKARAKINQQQLDQIRLIEKRISVLKKAQTGKRNALLVIGDPETTYKSLRILWDSLHASKMKVLVQQCEQFTALSTGLIKAEITASLDTNVLTDKLKIAFAGMNIKEDKIENICQHLLNSADPIAEWNGILLELEQLALYSVEGPNDIPSTPILNSCSLIQSERTRIATQFDSARWIELSVAELEFNPKFSYCTNKEKAEYIEFAQSSAGQQATALLTVLLNQPGAPLIIDQPEDDVDSKMVKDIIEQVWRAKSKRQLIFASHSANFVVNGDADLVACCDYVKAGDQTQGLIKLTGAIDNEKVREEITLVTEGGRRAFKLRMDKYGF